MNKPSALIANANGEISKLDAGISAFLADHSAGRRDSKWLSERTRIPLRTVQRKLGEPGAWTMREAHAIADAFGTDVVGLYRAGHSALDAAEAEDAAA